MRGDFSRGHEPDRKRGRVYRRVLLQMARPVLDSDVNASVDALLGEVRAVGRGLGCRSGSPDLGFLVTPGRLLVVFAEAEGIVTTAGTPEVWIDYRHRYAGRYPALRVAAEGGNAGVSIPLAQPFDPTAGSTLAALWLLVEQPMTIQVNGVGLDIGPDSPQRPQRIEFDPGGASLDRLTVEVPDGEEVWLFLAEQDQPAGSHPALWVAPGTYHLDGLVVDARGGGAFPDTSFPEEDGFTWVTSPHGPPPLDGLLPGPLTTEDRLVAYLEAHERHVTHLEDPGIREVALGGTDTTTRAQLLGQVKLATFIGPAEPEAAAGTAKAGFAAVEASGGQLTVEVSTADERPDPCDLPEVGGYSGADNRLYRFEVHRGGGLSQVRIVWSRNNGAELFPATQDASGNLVLDAATPLTGGDLVEVLSDVVELGDDVVAAVDPGGFAPAQGAVGQLAQLVVVEGAGASDEVVVTLVDPDDPATAVTLDDRYGDLSVTTLKLRRWDGILDPQRIAGSGAVALAGPHAIEDGLMVRLSPTGSYRPRQWWQYEARVGTQNANGPWRADPHGPERHFAPLALLEYRGPERPLRLLAWLDQRFSRLCELDADDLAFAGERVGSGSDTVQEALEELFEKPPVIVDASCGEIVVRPENDLQAVFDTIPPFGDARLCLHPGTWQITETVLVEGKGNLVVSGAGEATRLVADGVDSVLRFEACANVSLRDLAIEGGQEGRVGDGLAGSLAVTNSGGLDLERVRVSCGSGLLRSRSAVEVRSDGPPAGHPRVRIRNCEIRAGHAQVGILVISAASVEIHGNQVISEPQEFSLAEAIADQQVRGRIGRRLIYDTVIGETDEFPNDFLLGGDNVLETEPADPQDRLRVLAYLREWGNQYFAFTAGVALGSDGWRALLVENPIRGNWPPGQTAENDRILTGLRRLRAGMATSMFQDPPLTLPAGVLDILRAMGRGLAARNTVSAGDQGIVIAGRGAPVDFEFYEFGRLPTDLRPDAHVTGNRILGFTEGIHVAAGREDLGTQLSYRVNIADNTVHLRLPSLARERYGIFVGGAYHLRVHGNAVEVREPGPFEWFTLPPVDGIRIWGLFGASVQVRENMCIGTTNGVLAHAVNYWMSQNWSWRWAVSDTAHVSSGGVPEVQNW